MCVCVCDGVGRLNSSMCIISAYFGEVANKMAAIMRRLGQHVEEKRFHVKVECLVLQK